LKYNKDIEKIYDIAAMRIILKKEDDCYRTLGIIHANFRPLPGRIKDYIAFPKQNGYQGLHTTVFTGDGGIVEIQIKTEKMSKEAEYGIASHISYKAEFNQRKLNPNLEWIKRILPSTGQTEGSLNHKDVPTWIRDLADYHNHNKNEPETMTDIKSDFFSERIFVFTPKGDVVDLPAHSSVIDFAYSIHSDIGNHIGGAKVNGKMTSIESELKNGDIVEIITNKNAKPNRKWLDCVKTTFAKKHIRNHL
jgi:GTP pyrophosphokinase